MSKIGQFILDQPIEEIEAHIFDEDPAYIAWSAYQDAEDIKIQDEQPEPF